MRRYLCMLFAAAALSAALTGCGAMGAFHQAGGASAAGSGPAAAGGGASASVSGTSSAIKNDTADIEKMLDGIKNDAAQIDASDSQSSGVDQATDELDSLLSDSSDDISGLN